MVFPQNRPLTFAARKCKHYCADDDSTRRRLQFSGVSALTTRHTGDSGYNCQQCWKSRCSPVGDVLNTLAWTALSRITKALNLHLMAITTSQNGNEKHERAKAVWLCISNLWIV